MIFPCGEGNIMILPCGQSAVQTKRGQTVLIRSHWATNQLPYHGCMDNTLVRNHIQPSGFTLVLYVVTALVHYTPYSPARGGLTITNHSVVKTTNLFFLCNEPRYKAKTNITYWESSSHHCWTAPSNVASCKNTAD